MTPGADPEKQPDKPPKPEPKALPKRFYETVSVSPISEEGGSGLLLDGRSVKTPGRQPLALPTESLAEAVAEEWRAQEEVIDPATMPLTRLANTAIDGVSENKDAVADDIAAFAGTDLLCYWADGPDGLVAVEAEHWTPPLRWAEQRFGGPFALAEGIVHVEQPEEQITALRAALDDHDAFVLTALHMMTSLTGSALLALAVAEGEMTPEEAWTAAHVDEDWQIRQWGEDSEAAQRRALRQTEFDTAARMLALLQE